MKKILLLMLIVGLMTAFALPAPADLSFSAPHVGRSDNRYIEVGATATIRIAYTNTTGNSVGIDSAVLYVDYVDSVIEQSSVSIANLHSGNFTVNENNTGTPGSIRFQLRTDPGAGQSALVVANNASVDLAQITFHVNQGATVGSESYFIRFTTTNRANNVIVTQNGPSVTGNIIDPTGGNAIHL